MAVPLSRLRVPVGGLAAGILLMLAAQVVIMPASDAVAKYLVATLPVVQVAWARFALNFLLLAPVAFWNHRRYVLFPARPRLQLLRGILMVASNLLFVAGLRFVPLAEAAAIAFVAPLAVAAFSPFVLREPVGRFGWAAVAAGFVGTLVIIRPGLSGIGLTALLPLGAGLGFAGYLLVTRKLAGISPPLVTQTATAAIGAAVTSFLLPFAGWSDPGPFGWGLMLAIGCATCVGHVLITTAHVYAPAATLAPLTYLSLVSATALGFLVFGNIPDAPTWLGAAIVVGSGLAIWRYGRT